MNSRRVETTTWDEARALMELPADPDEAQVRAAYMAKVRQHPPDRDPEMFERIRDAYEQLRDPRRRAEQILAGPDPRAPLADLFKDVKPQRRYVGPGPWLDVLKERRS